LSENKAVNKFLFAAAAFLLIVAFPIRGQTPPPSFPSGADAFGAPPISTPPSKKVDPEKEKLIRKVMARTKEAEQAQERILQALAGMKILMPRVGEKFWEKYRQLITIEELRNRLVYVYDKHYTPEDLNELLKLYDSPLGKKMSDEAIPILRESMDIAQELSKRAGQSVAADFQAEQLLQRPRAAGSLGPGIPPSNPVLPSASSPTATATATPP
jgi:hypothetical protein